MKNLMTKVQNFIQDESGPTAVEYAVMLALIIVVCIGAVTAIGNSANAQFTVVDNALQPGGN